ncbi:hypothetical protein FACS1894159_04210 [Bacteroidia bacterium]|nr:hypothetical protein FACS1894159_04210 [Bacteroidia bacterium]
MGNGTKRNYAVIIAATISLSCVFAAHGTKSGKPELVKYQSCNGLVLTGYQGWFNTPDDGAGLGWKHYQKSGKFQPGYCTIDLWPDVSDYPKTYPSPFVHADGRPAHVFSSHDESTIDLHFNWMKQYGIDGAFMQRFLTSIRNPRHLENSDHILMHALDAAEKYGRGICVMYDLSGMQAGEERIVIEDWKRLTREANCITSRKDNHYIHHNGKPLVGVWGVGFSNGRAYNFDHIERIVDFLLDEGCGILLGVPARWRTLTGDALGDVRLHEMIRKCDIVLPWLVGRFNMTSYARFQQEIVQDIEWCDKNGVDYLPVLYPGFSWHNLQQGAAPSDAIPRLGGRFFWAQAAGAVQAGAKSFYLAMFDEIDEGTAFFKCTNDPPVGLSPFVSYEGLPTDHYLWLAGQAALMLRGEKPVSTELPARK